MMARTGKGRCSTSTVPKFSDIPRLAMRYFPEREFMYVREGRQKQRTIGSCGTGLGPISTRVSAATPPDFIVQVSLLSATQLIY